MKQKQMSNYDILGKNWIVQRNSQQCSSVKNLLDNIRYHYLATITKSIQFLIKQMLKIHKETINKQFSYKGKKKQTFEQAFINI